MSRRNIYIVVGLLLVLLVAGYWFLLLSPLRAEIGTVEENITREQQELTVARTKLAQLEGIRKRAEKNRGRILELGKMLPPEPQIPSLLLQVQDLAIESGISFMSISPNVGDPEGGVSVSYTHLRAHETDSYLVCRLLLVKKNNNISSYRLEP